MHLPRSVSSHEVIPINFIRFPAGAGRALLPWSSLAAPTMTFFNGLSSIHRVDDTDGMRITRCKMVALFCGTIVCFSRLRVVVRSFAHPQR